MVAEQINNKEILRIYDRYIKGKKNQNYFLISTGGLSVHKLNPVHEKSLEYTGENKFLELIEEALDENPYCLGISIFEKAVRNLKDKSLFFKKIILNKEQPQSNNNSLKGFNGLDGLGMFGGIEGVIQSNMDARILDGKNKDLRTELDKFVRKNETLSKENKALEEKIKDFKEAAHEKKWELRNTVQEHENEVRSIKDGNDKFEKVVTIGGYMLAKTAGWDAEDLRGILGFEDNEAIENKDDDKDDDNKNVVFEETYEGKKKQAKEISDNIYKFLIDLIEKNDEETALKLTNSINYIITYVRTDIENLKRMIDFIVNSAKAESSDQKSAADSIIEQAENIKNNE